MPLPNPIVYDPTTKNLSLLEQDFRVDTVYHDEGVWCIKLKDPDKPLYITNGRRLIPALNFAKGRFLFLKYIRSGGISPQVFKATLNDEVTIGDAMVVYRFLTNNCSAGIKDWMDENGFTESTLLTVGELLNKATILPDHQVIVDYFNRVDDFSQYEIWETTIPYTEPPTINGGEANAIEL